MYRKDRMEVIALHNLIMYFREITSSLPSLQMKRQRFATNINHTGLLPDVIHLQIINITFGFNLVWCSAQFTCISITIATGMLLSSKPKLVNN